MLDARHRYADLVDRRAALRWGAEMAIGIAVALASLTFTVTQRAWLILGVLLVLMAVAAVGLLIRPGRKPD